jgi:branched-chain amino acid transport system substrate-binding protein
MLSQKIRSSISALVLALTSIVVIGIGGAQELLAQEKQEVKIGAILPLTGVISSVGEAMQRGLQMAAGDAKHISVKLIVEDDATANRTKAVSSAKKLASVDKVDIVFNAYASTVSAFASVLKNADVPCLVLWDSNRSLQKLGSHIIGFGFENELAGEDMADFSRHKLTHKSVGIVSFHDEWSEVITAAFETRFKESGGRIALHEQVNGDTTDFRTIMTRLKSLKPDAVYLPLYGIGLQSAIKQARAVHFEGEILTADSFVDADISATHGASEGMYLTQIWLRDNDFARKYQTRFGQAEISGTNLGYVALAYDAVMLVDALAAKMRQSGAAVTSQTLMKQLPNFSFSGVLGTTVFSSHNSLERREKIFQVREGHLVEVAG